MQDVTSKVAPSVSSSFKEIGSSTKEVWLDPLREITRDIAGDVREAFRPGGASEAHASLRATAADARGATPRNVAASASSRDAAGASALSFRGGIGWEPSPSSKPPSAGERLESIFAALEAGTDDTDLEAAERGARGGDEENLECTFTPEISKRAKAVDLILTHAPSKAFRVFQAKMRNHHGLSALDYALHLKLDGYHTMFAVFYRHKVHDDHRGHGGHCGPCGRRSHCGRDSHFACLQMRTYAGTDVRTYPVL